MYWSTVVLIALIIIVIFVVAIIKIKLSYAMTEVGKEQSPWCVNDISPSDCSFITEPINYTNELIMGAQLMGRFASEIASGVPYTQLVGYESPFVVYNNIDSQPMALIYSSTDSSNQIIVIRGTITKIDGMDDLKYGEAAELTPNIKVHKGIYGIYSNIKSEILNNIKLTNTTIIGHSLGSAVAYMLAYDLIGLGIQVTVYAFAPPRSGNSAFTQYVGQHAKCLSIINLADVIPTLPFTFMPNINKKDNYVPFQYDHVLPTLVANNPKLDLLACHQMPAYYELVSTTPV